MSNAGRCRSCSAPILWACTPAEKVMPLDAKPVAGGNVAAHLDENGNLWARSLRVGEEPHEHETRYVTHFSTCPNGSLHRRGARETHPDDFARWDTRFGGFTLDAAAAAHNAKCSHWYTREDDGLKLPWAGERVWCNPPYSGLDAWLAKAWAEWPRTRGIVMLLPANRCEQPWWQQRVEPVRDRPGSPLTVEFLPGRLRFVRPDAVIGPKGDRPPFGCCLAIWTPPGGWGSP